MIRWLERLMHTGERQHYEEEVRAKQQEQVKRYAEVRKRELDERLAYLEATAEALRHGEAANGNAPSA